MKRYKIYTDGSYNKIDGIAHGGVVFWDEATNKPLNRMHVLTTLNPLSSMWNVGGEILASWIAIKSVVAAILQNGINEEEIYEIELVYDYEGVGKWLTGSWKAKKPATIWYVQSVKNMLRMIPNLTITYTWVKGHDCTEGNNEADRVAAYDTSYCVRNNIPVVDVSPLVREETRW